MANLWDRQPNEPERWFLRFDAYRRAGVDRAIETVWRQERQAKGENGKQGRPSRHWYEASQTWRWKERASAWDNYLRAEDDREWAERRAQIRKDDWDMAVALREKARQMLMFPVTKVTKDEDDKLTIIEPANWSFSDAAKIADLASKLARLTAGMEDAAKQEPTNVITWSPEQWKAEAEQRRQLAQEALAVTLENQSA